MQVAGDDGEFSHLCLFHLRCLMCNVKPDFRGLIARQRLSK